MINEDQNLPPPLTALRALDQGIADDGRGRSLAGRRAFNFLLAPAEFWIPEEAAPTKTRTGA